MDVVIRAPHLAAPVYVDVTVVSALSQEALAGGSSNRDGAAAANAAKGKVDDYPLCPVTPFVIEDHGRLGDDALRLARVLAPSEPAARSKAIRLLYHSLGAVVQRYAADSVITATTVQGPRRESGSRVS